MWKWNPSFLRGCRKSFPIDLLEIEEVQDSRHFQISKTISTDKAPNRSDPADAPLQWGEPQATRLR
jgi:hypothetical protein